MSRENELATNIINRFQVSDPDMFQILTFLNNGLTSVNDSVFPTERITTPVTEPAPLSDTPANFIYEIKARFVQFNWDPAEGAILYELREGSVWATGDIRVRTNTLQADLDPIPSGTTRFMLKSINIDGIECTTEVFVDVIVPAISGFTLSSQVIDNTVLLNWSVPTGPYEIEYYDIYRDSTKVGSINGTFTTIYELIAGTFDYGVQAVDIAGGLSPLIITEATVTQPPDFELQSSIDSVFDGTKTNVVLIDGVLAACVVNETYQDHFINNSWSTPQDQVDAGYPQFIQPTAATGLYEEPDIDYGAVITNVIANVSFATGLPENQQSSVVVVSTKMWGSPDDIDWSDGPHTSASHFFPSLRYLRVHVLFSSTDDLSLIFLNSLHITLSVKREDDGGETACLATDATGTPETFNKPFLDIDTITATAKSTVEKNVIVDFVDVPNPTGFSIYVFDSAGSRVNATVEWKARGVV